ncbi:hypothetical protein GCM10023310_02260 [Paenibacillus vulneris]
MGEILNDDIRVVMELLLKPCDTIVHANRSIKYMGLFGLDFSSRPGLTMVVGLGVNDVTS